MQAAGLGIRRQDFFRLWGQAQKEISAESEINALEPHQRPSAASIGKWGSSPGNEGYMHIVNYTRLDRITHLPEQGSIVIKSDTLLTKGEAEATAEEILRENEAKYPEKRILSWSLTAVRQLVPEA